MVGSRNSRKDDHATSLIASQQPHRTFFFCLICGLLSWTHSLPAQGPGDARARKKSGVSVRSIDRAPLAPQEWSRLDRAVDRGIAFIAKSQARDGSFPTADDGQPGVTGLCVLAFLARGHHPGKGPYGAALDRAIDYVLDVQDPYVGNIFPERFVGGRPPKSYGGNYSHGICGLMLGEVFGMTDARRHERIREAINRALGYSRSQQLRPKQNPDERGGWRYVHDRPGNESDLSVTAWQLMFLRSARNAEFSVPEEWIREAMGYVHRSFDANERGFVYALSGDERYCSRGMVGAGIVCLELGGEHRSETGLEAAKWIHRHRFEPYNNSWHPEDRYHYSAFYCSQAMFQLGGDDWHQFFPRLLKVLAEAQHRDGSWDPEMANGYKGDAKYGRVYTTALAVLALSTPYQLLPIYQR